MPGAREIAYDLTRRVNESGAYLGLLLRYTMQDSELAGRDRAMISELTYGVQRQRNKMDYIIELFSSRPLAEIEGDVLDILRLGVYQIAEMRIPAHASVNETVDLAKRKMNPGAIAFVNAVLRNVAKRLDELEWPPRSNFPYYLEINHSHPRWLVDYILETMDEGLAEALCAADNHFPGISMRANPMRTERETLLTKILDAGGRAKSSQYLDEGIIKASLPRRLLLDLLQDGMCAVQDESSMLVSHVLNPQPGNLVVDACAAPGGKASHLAQLGGESARIIAVDKNPRRLEALGKTLRRLALDNVEVIEGDSTQLDLYVSQPADAILVDAPCSGLGTLRRRPELKWRRSRGELGRFGDGQLRMLEGCAGVPRPGGAMVFSVCTFTREETLDVIEAFLDRRPDYTLDDVSSYLPPGLRSSVSSAGYIQLMPHLHDMDGMFIARLIRMA